jgi:hypothetical protein
MELQLLRNEATVWAHLDVHLRQHGFGKIRKPMRFVNRRVQMGKEFAPGVERSAIAGGVCTFVFATDCIGLRSCIRLGQGCSWSPLSLSGLGGGSRGTNRTRDRCHLLLNRFGVRLVALALLFAFALAVSRVLLSFSGFLTGLTITGRRHWSSRQAPRDRDSSCKCIHLCPSLAVRPPKLWRLSFWGTLAPWVATHLN